jgi:hypothetical protein
MTLRSTLTRWLSGSEPADEGPPHGVFQFRLPLDQTKSFVQWFHQSLLVLSSLTHQFVAALPTAFCNVSEVQ